MLTPSQALCLSCVTYWVRVVKKKQGSCGLIDESGRAFTHVTAQQVSEWIEANYKAHVSTKSAQLNLKRLVELGFLVREKKHLQEWKSTYLYALGEGNEVTCAVPFPHEENSVSPVKGNQSATTNTLAFIPTNQKQPVEETRSQVEPPSGVNYRSTGLHSKPTWASGARSLAEILELTGGGELPEIRRCKDGFLIRDKTQ